MQLSTSVFYSFALLAAIAPITTFACPDNKVFLGLDDNDQPICVPLNSGGRRMQSTSQLWKETIIDNNEECYNEQHSYQLSIYMTAHVYLIASPTIQDDASNSGGTSCPYVILDSSFQLGDNNSKEDEENVNKMVMILDETEKDAIINNHDF